MKKLDGKSQDILAENIQSLSKIFPDAMTDGKVDFNALKELLGEFAEEKREKFQFSWFGKSKCRQIALAPSTGTLRPAQEKSINWKNGKNLFIEGDNLETLKLLQKSYHNKVKMIYIDPPYNTGKEFVYPDNYQDNLDTYLKYTSQKDEDGFKISTNTDTGGRFHTNWLNMMYPRLKLARNLLTRDGVIFMSIDDNEYANLKKIADEIFGEENFVDNIVWNKRVPKNDKGIGNIHEYILIYVKDNSLRHIFKMAKDGMKEVDDLRLKLKRSKTEIKESEIEIKKLYKKRAYDRGITLYNSLDDNYDLWGKINMSWPNANTFGPTFDVLHPETKKPVKVPDRGWRWNEAKFSEELDYENSVKLHDGSFRCGNIWFGKDENTQPSSIKLLKDVENLLLRTIISVKSDGGIAVEKLFEGKSFFSYPKPVGLLKTLISSIDSKDGDIILDFFAGSSTTAQAIIELNHEDDVDRKFIMVQLPEPVSEDTEAFRAGYKNLAELSLDRIKKIISQPDYTEMNIGVKAFVLDSSNIKEWDINEDDIEGTLFEFVTNIKDDRSEDDLLYEVLLKYGLDLTLPIEEKMLGKNKVFSIGLGALLICFSDKIDLDLIEGIGTLKDELKPEVCRVVFKDSGFVDDNVKTNAIQILKQHGVNEVKSL
jgi:adenine-specific DNA-methyltransferase